MIVLASFASASVVVGAAAVNDAASAHTFVGVDLSLYADQTKGFDWFGRAAIGWGPLGSGPGGVTEFGGMVVTPSEEENVIIRFGAGFRGVHLVRDLQLPVQSNNRPTGENRHGIIPSAFLNAELAWTPDAPFVIGAQLGMGVWGSQLAECGESLTSQECVEWPLGIVASATVRKVFPNGLTLHGHIGTYSSLGVGWRIPTKNAP